MDNNPNPNTTSIGIDGNLAALLSYLVGILGIIVLVTEKENKFVRFHALQALLFHLSFIFIFFGAFVLFFVLAAFGTLAAALGNAGAIIGMILYVIAIAIWFGAIILGPITILGGSIYGGIQAYQGKWFKMPVVGKLSMKFLGIQN